jgi:SAM-dependent methyltransferase
LNPAETYSAGDGAAGPASETGPARRRPTPEEAAAWLAAEVLHHRPTRSWRLLRLLAADSRREAFLDRRWVAPLLRLAPPAQRRGLALRLLALSPHYWLYQWSNRYPVGTTRGEILEREAARVAASRELLCERLLAPYLRPEMTVLDLGTGPGFLARALGRRAFAVVGTDVSRGAVACARALNPAENVTYLLQPADRLHGIDDGSIDVLCSFAVFQHLRPERLVALAREIRRVLKPGGVALCHVPLLDPDDPPPFPPPPAGWLRGRLWPSMTYYRPDDLRGLLAEAGWPDVEVRRIGDLAEVSSDGDEIGREHLLVLRRPWRSSPLGHGEDERAGKSWAERVREGSLLLPDPGKPLVARPLDWPTLRGLALFSHLDVPVSVTVRVALPAGEQGATIALGPGESRFVAELFPEGGLELGTCRELRVEAAGEMACSLVPLVSGKHLHVLLLGPSCLDELPAVARRYALSDPRVLLGPFRRHDIPDFPDDNDAQRRLYDYLVARSREGLARLLDPSPPLPPEQRIRHAIHWIWLRATPGAEAPEDAAGLDEKYLWRMHTWAARNPTFELNLWTDAGPRELLRDPAALRLYATLFGGRLRLRGPEEICALLDGNRLDNREVVADLFHNLASTAGRSDVLRLLVLLAEGGLYCDLNDTECLAPLGPLCDRFSFVVGFDRYNRVQNAVLGSARGHHLTRELLRAVKAGSEAVNRELAEGSLNDHVRALLQVCGPYLLSQSLCELIDRGLVAPPDALLLPFPFFHDPKVRQSNPLALVHHLSAMSWLDEEKRRRGADEGGVDE